MSNTAAEPPIRVIAFFKRKPGLSDEEFYNHWENVHGPLLAPWIVKHGIENYSQIHTTPNLKSHWSSLLVPPLSNPMPTFPYDGYAEMQFSSPEKMRAAFLDSYYREIIEPDEWNFIEKEGGEYGSEPKSTMGFVKHIVLGGKSMVGNEKVNTEGKKGD